MTKEEIENYFVECAGYGRDKIRNFMDIVNKALEQKNERITELEQKLEQAEKDLADYQFNYPTIKELQKEIEELKKTYRKQRNKRIDELQKENAELKTQIEKIKWHYVKDEIQQKSEEFKICSEDLLFITKNGKRYFGYFNSRNQFEAHNQPYGRFRAEEVYAWKEIKFPKLKESE